MDGENSSYYHFNVKIISNNNNRSGIACNMYYIVYRNTDSYYNAALDEVTDLYGCQIRLPYLKCEGCSTGDREVYFNLPNGDSDTDVREVYIMNQEGKTIDVVR